MKRCICVIAFSFFLSVSSSCFADFIYILNNNNNGVTSGSVAVFNETTLLPLTGSPFTTVIPGLSGQAGQQMVINASGTRLYVANASIPNTISVLDTDTMLPIAGSPFSSGGMDAGGIAINPVAPYIYVTNYLSDTVSRLDEASLALLGAPVASGGLNPNRILVNPNGSIVYVINSNSVNLTAFDATLNPILAPIVFVNFVPYSMAINPAGTILYIYGLNSMSSTSQVLAYDAITLALLSNPLAGFDGLDVPAAITVSADGARLYVLGRRLVPPSNDMQILNADPLSLAVLLGPVATGGGPNALAIALNPENTRLYVGESDSSIPPISRVSFYDSATLTPIPGSPLTSGIAGPVSILFGPRLAAPTNLQGSQKKNDFGLVYEYFNLLTWDAAAGVVSGYYIYRDGAKIATLDAASHEYRDHNREKGVATFYSVSSFNANGNESNSVDVLVN
ncbi:MAG: YncE family protein [Parachlamydiales bacterium]|nr:YncE family protein [Parachlamydiales bacterium]